MKKMLSGVVLGAIILAAAAFTWSRTAEHAPDLAEGLYVKCTRADCAHFYVIPWDEGRAYPRGPQGEGFRCPKCGQFAGQIATKCEQCGDWLVAAEAARGCPKCSPAGDSTGRGLEPPRSSR